MSAPAHTARNTTPPMAKTTPSVRASRDSPPASAGTQQRPKRKDRGYPQTDEQTEFPIRIPEQAEPVRHRQQERRERREKDDQDARPRIHPHGSLPARCLAVAARSLIALAESFGWS